MAWYGASRGGGGGAYFPTGPIKGHGGGWSWNPLELPGEIAGKGLNLLGGIGRQGVGLLEGVTRSGYQLPIDFAREALHQTGAALHAFRHPSELVGMAAAPAMPALLKDVLASGGANLPGGPAPEAWPYGGAPAAPATPGFAGFAERLGQRSPLLGPFAGSIGRTVRDIQELPRAGINALLPGMPAGADVGQLGTGPGLLGRTALARAVAPGGGGLLPRALEDVTNIALVAAPFAKALTATAKTAATEATQATKALTAAQTEANAARLAAVNAGYDPVAAARVTTADRALETARGTAEQATTGAARAQRIADIASRAEKITGKAAASPFAPFEFAGRRAVTPLLKAGLERATASETLGPILERARPHVMARQGLSEADRMVNRARLGAIEEFGPEGRAFGRLQRVVAKTEAAGLFGRSFPANDLDAELVAVMAHTGVGESLGRMLDRLPREDAIRAFADTHFPGIEPGRFELAADVFQHGAPGSARAAELRQVLPAVHELWAKVMAPENERYIGGRGEEVWGPLQEATARFNVEGTAPQVEHLREWQRFAARMGARRSALGRQLESQAGQLVRTMGAQQRVGVLPGETPEALVGRVLAPARNIAEQIVHGPDTEQVWAALAKVPEKRLATTARMLTAGKVAPERAVVTIADELVRLSNRPGLSPLTQGLVDLLGEPGPAAAMPRMGVLGQVAEAGAGRERALLGERMATAGGRQVIAGREQVARGEELMAQVVRESPRAQRTLGELERARDVVQRGPIGQALRDVRAARSDYKKLVRDVALEMRHRLDDADALYIAPPSGEMRYEVRRTRAGKMMPRGRKVYPGEYDFVERLGRNDPVRRFFNARGDTPDLVLDRMRAAGLGETIDDWIAHVEQIAKLEDQARRMNVDRGFTGLGLADPETERLLEGEARVAAAGVAGPPAPAPAAATPETAPTAGPRVQGRAEGRLVGAGEAQVAAGTAAERLGGRLAAVGEKRAQLLPEASQAAVEAVSGPIGRLYRRAGERERAVVEAARRFEQTKRAVDRLDARIAREHERLIQTVEAAPRRYRPIVELGRRAEGYLGAEADRADALLGPGAGDAYRAAAAEAFTTVDKVVAAGVDPQFLIGARAPGEELPAALRERGATGTAGARAPRRAKVGYRVAGVGAGLPTTLEEVATAFRQRLERVMNNEVANELESHLGMTPRDLLRRSGMKPGEIDALDNMGDIERAKKLRTLMWNEGGYRDWDLSPVQGPVGTKLPDARVKVDTTFMPGMIVKHFRGYDTHRYDAALVGYDRVLRFWKMSVLALTGRWHVGNIVGNAVMGTFGAGIAPDEYVRQMSRARRLLRITAAGAPTAEDLAWADKNLSPEVRAGLEEGIFAPGSLLKRGHITSIAEVKSVLPEQLHIGPFRHPAQRSYAFNGWVDDMNRLGIFMAKLEKGALSDHDLALFRQENPELAHMSETQVRREAAITLSLRAAGDFTRLTPFEQGIVRRVVPFYPWLRHITKLSYNLALHHPLRVAWALHLADLFDPGAPPVEFLRGTIPLGASLFLRLPSINPFTDVPRALGLGEHGLAPEEAFGAVSPLIGLAGAAGLGVDVRRGLMPIRRAPGTARTVEGREMPTGLLGRPGELAYWLESQFPQIAALREAIPALFGSEPIRRYPTGQPVVVGGRTIPANELELFGRQPPAYFGPLMQLLGIPRPSRINVGPQVARIAARQRRVEAQRARYASGG